MAIARECWYRPNPMLDRWNPSRSSFFAIPVPHYRQLWVSTRGFSSFLESFSRDIRNVSRTEPTFSRQKTKLISKLSDVSILSRLLSCPGHGAVGLHRKGEGQGASRGDKPRLFRPLCCAIGLAKSASSPRPCLFLRDRDDHVRKAQRRTALDRNTSVLTTVKRGAS